MSFKWRKKHIYITLKIHMILFLGAFFAGVLLISLRWADESFWLGYQAENALKQLAAVDISPLGFLHFLLKNRLPIWIILCIFAGFDRGKAVLLIFSGWTGLSLGILSAAFARQFSLFGILLTGTILVPQIFAYLPAYIVLIKNRRNRSALLFLKYALLSGIYVIGVICEYFLNPWFLQKIYTVMHVFFHNTP